MQELIAHWPLRGNTHDAAGENHGAAFNLTYGEGPNGSAQTAAVFNGLDGKIRVPDSPELRLNAEDFTISLWVKAQQPMRQIFGDLLSKFDASQRCGVNLHIAGSASAYSAMSDTRHVHFGIDDGYLSAWEECGRPWKSNPLICNLTVYQDELYCGIADAAEPMDAAHVFRYAGGKEWIDCGRLGNDPDCISAMSMIVQGGQLYAGSGCWDYRRAKGGRPGLKASPPHLYRYQGGTEWEDLGRIGREGATRAMCLASLDGELYVGTDNRGKGHCFKYDGSTWTDCGSPSGFNLQCLLPYQGTLYATTNGIVHRYEGGQSWTTIAEQPHSIAQIHSVQLVGGKFHLGTWPQGYVLRLEDDGTWTRTGRLGLSQGMPLTGHGRVHGINEVMDLVVYNGKLYCGLLPKAQVYRYEADGFWSLLGNLASRPDWSTLKTHLWCRATCMTSYQGRLYVGNGAAEAHAPHLDPEETLGRVHSLQAGQVVSHEHDIGGEWTHLAATRKGKKLRLYVNGKLSASSRAPTGHTFHLGNPQPLLIGFGAQNYFTGSMADVRLYRGALDAAEATKLSAEGT